MIRHVTRVSVLATLVGLWACNGGETPDPQHAPPAAPAEAEAPKAEVKESDIKGTDLEHSHLADAEVPFVLKLEATPAEMPDSGTVDLVARIEAPRGLPTPTSISIEVPPGATLVAGQPKEMLADLPAGTTVRTFKVEVGQKLGAPIKVSVGMVDPQGRFGAHATRLFPEPVEAPSVKTSRVPAPPVRRPGAGLAPTRTPGAGPTQPGTR